MSNDNAIITGFGAGTLRQSRVRSRWPSLHEENTYYVIRRYDSPAQREEMEDAYYSSDDWRQGPREATLTLIESYVDAVFELDEATLQGLQR